MTVPWMQAMRKVPWTKPVRAVHAASPASASRCGPRPGSRLRAQSHTCAPSYSKKITANRHNAIPTPNSTVVWVTLSRVAARPWVIECRASCAADSARLIRLKSTGSGSRRIWPASDEKDWEKSMTSWFHRPAIRIMVSKAAAANAASMITTVRTTARPRGRILRSSRSSGCSKATNSIATASGIATLATAPSTRPTNQRLPPQDGQRERPGHPRQHPSRQQWSPIVADGWIRVRC